MVHVYYCLVIAIMIEVALKCNGKILNILSLCNFHIILTLSHEIFTYLQVITFIHQPIPLCHAWTTLMDHKLMVAVQQAV